MRAHVIALFGSANTTRGDYRYEEARQLGRAIAEAGWTVCNGGYGGAMEASALGAVEAGGHTIGVTCEQVSAKRKSGANEYIRQEIPTFDLLTRVNTLMRLAAAYVVLPGGTGTLLELAAVWEYANKGFLRPRRPVVLLGDFWTPLQPIVRAEQPKATELLVAPDVTAVVPMLREALGDD